MTDEDNRVREQRDKLAATVIGKLIEELAPLTTEERKRVYDSVGTYYDIGPRPRIFPSGGGRIR